MTTAVVGTVRTPIVHVCAYYPPRLGGLERVTQGLAELLARRHDVEVLTTDPGIVRTERERIHPQLHVTRVPSVEIAHTPLSLQLVWRLLRLPRRALVHAHVAQAFLPEMVWLTSVLRRRPFLVHLHLDVDASGRFGRLLPAYQRLVLRPVLRAAAAVVVLSPQQAEHVARRYGVLHSRLAVIPNGVSPSFSACARERVPAHAAPAPGPLKVLFVGRLDAQKNLRRLLAAMARVTAPMELVVVGDGEEAAMLRARRATLGLGNVRFVGAQHGEALLEHYRWADVFVLPSDKEGMPLVVLEAMATGLPVVATDVPGSRELVDGVGLLAAPDPDSLATALDEVAVDRTLLADLAVRSRERSASFTWDSRLAEIEDLYRRIGSGS